MEKKHTNTKSNAKRSVLKSRRRPLIVVLGQNPRNWSQYEGRSGNPGGRRTAVISYVTNSSDKQIRLSHGGPGSVILNPRGRTSYFNRRRVAGNWTAIASVTQGTAPAAISITVGWTV